MPYSKQCVVTFCKVCTWQEATFKKIIRTDRKLLFFSGKSEPCSATNPLRCVYGWQRLQLWRGEVDAFPFKFLVDLDHPCEVWTAPEGICPSLRRQNRLLIISGIKMGMFYDGCGIDYCQSANYKAPSFVSFHSTSCQQQRVFEKHLNSWVTGRFDLKLTYFRNTYF